MGSKINFALHAAFHINLDSQAAQTLTIDGSIFAVGGLGGRDDYHYNGGSRLCCNNGGPGSVGRIRLD